MRSVDGDLDGRVHYLEYEGARTGPTFICLHALEGHHANWLGLAPLLAQRGRVLVPDLAGFGLTPLGARKSSLEENRRLVDRLITRETDGPVVLVGNSMGSAVALLQARARPSSVSGLVLIGPAVARSVRFGVTPWAVPVFASTLAPTFVSTRLARRLAPRGPEWFVRQMLLLCTFDPGRIPQEIIDANIAVASERIAHMPWATAAFNQAARSTMTLLASSRRFWSMMSSVATPTLVLGGSHDRLVPPGVVRAAGLQRPDWNVEVLQNTGHMPQLEAPELTAEAITRWLDARAA